MAKVGRLNVEVGASTKGLRSDLGGAERLVGKFKRDLDKLGDTSPLRHFDKSITKIGAGAGRLIGGVTRGLLGLGAAGVTAGAGLGVVAASQIDLIGDQADAAKKLGITRNELITLQRAAKSTGVDNDKLTSSFEKMSDVLGSAFRGDGGAKKAIEGIGLSVTDLQRMDPTKQFMAIGQAIDNIDDPAMRIAAARDVFGKAGGDLIPMFEQGAGAIAGAYRELGLFGNLLSNLDQSGIEKAGDAFDTFGTIVEGLKTRLAAEVSPLLVKIGEDTTAWITSLGGVEAIADKGLAKLADGVTKTSTAMNAATAAGRTASDVKAGTIDKAGGLLSKIPGGETIGKALTWNPVRDTVGAIYGKHKSDLALEAMQDKASRRMGGPALTTSGAIAQYAADARTDIEDDAAGVPRRSEARAIAAEPTAPRPVSTATSAWGRVSEEHGVERGRPTWQDRVPAEGPAKWESKVPAKDGPANWESKRPEPMNYVERDPMAMALSGNPMGKASAPVDMTRVEVLLGDIKNELRRGVKGVLS